MTAIFETGTVLNSVQNTMFVTNPKMAKFRTFPGINSHVGRHISLRGKHSISALIIKHTALEETEKLAVLCRK